MKATQRVHDADCRIMHDRSRRIRITGLACRLSAAAIGVLIAGVPVAAADAADDLLHQAHVAAGRVWYDKYCTPCHGPGGGPGSAVYRVGDKPVDLRRYVARHQGQLSRPRVDRRRRARRPLVPARRRVGADP